MRFVATTVLSLTALSAALPTLRSLKARQNVADTNFDDITISGGTAGEAESEALAVFASLGLDDPANIDEAGIDFLNEVNQVANDAETDAFNPAIEAATGDEAAALENGKTKNKVLKLEATILKLQAQDLQGEDVAAKLEEEQTKLDNNIATDVENAGQPSTALPFDAVISAGGNGGAGAGAEDNAAANDNGGEAEAEVEDDAGEAEAEPEVQDDAVEAEAEPEVQDDAGEAEAEAEVQDNANQAEADVEAQDNAGEAEAEAAQEEANVDENEAQAEEAEGDENEGNENEGNENEGDENEGDENEESQDEGSDDEGSDDEGSDDEGSDDEGSDDEGSDDEGSDDEDD